MLFGRNVASIKQNTDPSIQSIRKSGLAKGDRANSGKKACVECRGGWRNRWVGQKEFERVLQVSRQGMKWGRGN